MNRGTESLPHVVVLGAGFAGLTFCRHFPGHRARITLVDRQNHHLFQPLLYQVATAGLSAPDIAQPIRFILAGKPNLEVRMDAVAGVDLAARKLTLAGAVLGYDFLVLALGGVTSYFGRDDWEPFAPGLKSLDDALRIRRRILLAFERAETEADPERRRQLMTIVIVGGGPTGVELAGAFAELARNVLARDFVHIDPRDARVVLIEAGPRVLAHLPPALSESARRQLASLRVEVRTGAEVTAVREGELELRHDVLRAANVIWAAGVQANPITRSLGVPLDKAGRVKVLPDLSLPGHPEAFALGDMATLVDRNGVQVPGVSPAAMQMGRHAARLIVDECRDGPHVPERRRAFAYWDKGTMATIGRSRAVATVGRFRLRGFPAWVAWLVVHLVFLIGFRNRVAVMLNWAYSYLTYRRGARIVIGLRED